MRSNTLLFVCVAVCSILGYGQIVEIPDTAFKNALLNHSPVIDTNSDGEIQISEAMAFDGIMDVSGTQGNPGNIADLTGLEAFENLDELRFSYNQVSILDTSSNVLLRNVRGDGNPLQVSDFSENPLMRTISFSGHQLSSLDVSNNNKLLLLQCNFGPLESIVLGNQPDLQFLYVQDNQLSQINISQAPFLIAFICGFNQLTHINTDNNPLLDYFACRNNNLDFLDVSNNPNLDTFDCQSNPEMWYINLQNGSNSELDISANGSNFMNLPALETVCVDALDTPLTEFITAQTGNTINYITDCFLHVSDLESNEISLYPNPVLDMLYVESTKLIRKAQMVDLLGKTVLDLSNQSGIDLIDTSGLQSGLYMLILTDSTERKLIRKIIKN